MWGRPSPKVIARIPSCSLSWSCTYILSPVKPRPPSESFEINLPPTSHAIHSPCPPPPIFSLLLQSSISPQVMESGSQIADEFDKTLTLQEAQKDDDEDEDEDEDSVSSDFEFSFAGAGDTSSPVSAEEIFQNGQIRPIFPFNVDDKFDEATTSYGPPVRKLFVKSSPERDDIAEGPYCAWSFSEKSPAKATAPAPEMSRKSNSTGFSKLWRFRDLLVRSHSDGKDAFVFLNPGKGEEKSTDMASEKKMKREKIRVERKERETTTLRGEKKHQKEKGKEKSAYEVLYGKREKKTGKGKSYLPYKQDLMGFFTNVNGMSRNVHPY